MRVIAFVLLALAWQIAPAPAQDQWREFRAESDGFTVAMPRTPTITSRRIGKTDATQTMFLIEAGQITYLVSVVQMAKGTGPKNPDNAYFQNLMKNYTDGSKTTLLVLWRGTPGWFARRGGRNGAGGGASGGSSGGSASGGSYEYQYFSQGGLTLVR